MNSVAMLKARPSDAKRTCVRAKPGSNDVRVGGWPSEAAIMITGRGRPAASSSDLTHR